MADRSLIFFEYKDLQEKKVKPQKDQYNGFCVFTVPKTKAGGVLT